MTLHTLTAEFCDVFSLIMRQLSCSMESNYYSKVYAQTLGPLAILLFLYFMFMQTKQSAYFDMLLFVSFIVYAPTSAILIQYFDCYPAWHGGKGTEMTKYLLMDPSIKCTDDKYILQAVTYVLPMCVVFVIGFPMYYATLLWADRHTIKPKSPSPRFQAKLKSARNKVIPSEAVLKLALADYLGYHPTKAELEVLFSFWSHQTTKADEARERSSSVLAITTTVSAASKWQAKLKSKDAAKDDKGGSEGNKKLAVGKVPIKYAQLEMLIDFGERHFEFRKRKADGSAGVNEIAPVLENVPPALRHSMQAASIRAYATVITASLADRERWVIQSREGDERPQRSGFLWKAYRPQYYWFEVFDMLRKVCHSAVRSFVPPRC